MRLRNLVLFFVLFLLLFLVFAQLAARARPRFDPNSPLVAVSGEEMYTAYCEECHGRDAKGGGRPAAAFGIPVPDLTTLSKKNAGRFPYGVVRDAIRGEEHSGVYGPGMPAWGFLFRYVGSGSRLEVELRINRLTEYIRSLQEK